MAYYHFKATSENSKLGPMASMRVSKDTCPDVCPLKDAGCYAAVGRLNFHWRKLDNSGLSLSQVVKVIKALPRESKIRLFEAGDSEHENGIIKTDALQSLVDATTSRDLDVIAYTHHDLTIDANVRMIEKANRDGMTLNISLNNLSEIDKFRHVNAPKVVILPEGAPIKFEYSGHSILTCPNQLKSSITCSKCMLCAKKDRDFIIGFRAHGIQKRKVNALSKAVI